MSHLLEQLEGRERRAECAKHDKPWILPVSGPLTSADIAALRASHQRLKEALASDISELEYFVGNPSAWDGYDEGMSERIRKVVVRAREALRSAP